jgi:single-stranded DNA-binding protein
MFERPDGARIVVTYAQWKYKYKGETLSAETQYRSTSGFIQFDPNTREAHGKTITDYTVKAPGGDGVLVRVSVWQELAENLDVELEKGDWIAADGAFSINTWDDKTTGEKRSQPQISANSLAVVKGVRKSEREVVTSTNSF